MDEKLTKEQIAKEKILDAAMTVVYEHTISGTRMHLIAEKTDMVQSNIHYYYKTKEQLLEDLQRKISAKGFATREKIRGDYPDTLEGQLEVFIRQKLDFILEHPEYDLVEMDFWLQANVKPNIRKQLSKSFAGWRADVERMIEKFSPDMEEKYRQYLPFMIISLLEGATVQYHIDPEAFNVKEYFAHCKRMILTLVDNAPKNGER